MEVAQHGIGAPLTDTQVERRPADGVSMALDFYIYAPVFALYPGGELIE